MRKRSINGCICYGPCEYKNTCNAVMGICSNNWKQCKVNPDECNDNEYDWC